MNHDHHNNPMSNREAVVTIIQLLGLLLMLSLLAPIKQAFKWVVERWSRVPQNPRDRKSRITETSDKSSIIAAGLYSKTDHKG